MKIRKTTEADIGRVMEIYAHARKFMAEHGNPKRCGHIRIDTHGDNYVMQGCLKKLGFAHCGTVYVEEDDDPRLAFEKVGDL